MGETGCGPNAREPHNDLQKHLLAKLQRTVNDQRQVYRDLVNAVIDAHKHGVPRDDIAEDLFRGSLLGRRP